MAERGDVVYVVLDDEGKVEGVYATNTSAQIASDRVGGKVYVDNELNWKRGKKMRRADLVRILLAIDRVTSWIDSARDDKPDRAAKTVFLPLATETLKRACATAL